MFRIGAKQMTNPEPGNRLQRLERLIEVCRNLGKSEDVERLLQSIVSASCELTRSQYSYILVYEEETDLLKIVAGPPAHRDTIKRIRVPLEKSLAGWVYSQSKPMVLHNAHNDPRIFRDIERAAGYVTNSILAVPLIFRGETIGVLEAINKQNNLHYTEEDLTILDTLASQAAVATLSTLLFDETKEAYDDVKELEKMKSDFIAVASHELRTPLGLILGHATFLHELIVDEQHKNQIDIIIRNAIKLKTIIDDLSKMDSFQSGSAHLRTGIVPINSLVKKIVNLNTETAIQKNISLNAKLPPSEVTIEGDEDKLGIILNNLIKNALTFTDRNGHILVTLEQLPGYVQITVTDDGIGIPAKDLPHIFERFFQVQSHLTRRHGGLGLGLTVAKTMVEMHKGQIWVESVEGKGSKFFVLLPMKITGSPAKERVFQV